MNEKQPEEIMRQVLELEKELKTIKNRTERPIPVAKDRQGRMAKDLTLKEWFQKLNEEVDEVKIAASAIYLALDVVPGRYEYAIFDCEKKGIAGEMCDIIKVLYSMANQMGIDGDFMDKAMHECNEKTRRRGCHE